MLAQMHVVPPCVYQTHYIVEGIKSKTTTVLVLTANLKNGLPKCAIGPAQTSNS